MIGSFRDANRGHGLQHFHGIVWSEFFEHGRTDGGVREDPEEGSVRAANAIVVIDRGDGTNHCFEQLSCKRALAARFQNTTTQIPKVSLHLPNCSGGHESADEKSDYYPPDN